MAALHCGAAGVDATLAVLRRQAAAAAALAADSGADSAGDSEEDPRRSERRSEGRRPEATLDSESEVDEFQVFD